VQEETESLQRDLLSGGRLIEKMLQEYIWHGLELRRMARKQEDAEEIGKQKSISP